MLCECHFIFWLLDLAYISTNIYYTNTHKTYHWLVLWYFHELRTLGQCINIEVLLRKFHFGLANSVLLRSWWSTKIIPWIIYASAWHKLSTIRNIDRNTMWQRQHSNSIKLKTLHSTHDTLLSAAATHKKSVKASGQNSLLCIASFSTSLSYSIAKVLEQLFHGSSNSFHMLE